MFERVVLYISIHLPTFFSFSTNLLLLTDVCCSMRLMSSIQLVDCQFNPL